MADAASDVGPSSDRTLRQVCLSFASCCRCFAFSGFSVEVGCPLMPVLKIAVRYASGVMSCSYNLNFIVC